MIVIPAIDLRDGKCVRLLQGDFANSTEYSNDPVAMARVLAEYSTSDLHIVDLDGAQTGTQSNRELVAEIAAKIPLRVQLGGGIRDSSTIENWLDSGVDRCVIGSLAITQPDTVKSWLAKYGAERIVLAFDVIIDDDKMPMVTTHGWTRPSETSVFECITDYEVMGLRHVLCTDVSRDGAMSGPNVSLYSDILERFPGLQLQASGGVRDLSDLEDLREAGLPAAITGRALLDGRITVSEVASFRQNA